MTPHLACFYPTSLILEFPKIDQSRKRRTSKREAQAITAAMGALLHERCHLLQHIGTTAGLFRQALTDCQAIRTYDLCRELENDLSRDSLPLIESTVHSGRAYETWLTSWRALEMVHQAFHGNVDIAAVERLYPLQATLQMLFAHCWSLLRLHRSTPRSKAWRRQDEWWRSSLEKMTVEPMILREDDGVFGAGQLMEAQARLNELIRLEEYARMFSARLDQAAYLQGQYGTAIEVFHSLSGMANSAESTTAFAIVADWALNPPIPPVAPPMLHETGWASLLPGARFAVASRALQSLEAKGQLGGETASEVETFISSIESTLFSQGLDLNAARAMSVLRTQLLGVSDENPKPIAISDDLAKAPSHGLDRYHYVHWRFLFNRAMQAAATRIARPEMFVVPGMVYLRDRADFHRHFDALDVPMVIDPEGNLRPNNGHEAVFQDFFLAGVFWDCARWIVFSDFDDLCGRLKRYAGCPAITNAKEATIYALTHLVGDSPLVASVAAQL